MCKPRMSVAIERCQSARPMRWSIMACVALRMFSWCRRMLRSISSSTSPRPRSRNSNASKATPPAAVNQSLASPLVSACHSPAARAISACVICASWYRSSSVNAAPSRTAPDCCWRSISAATSSDTRPRSTSVCNRLSRGIGRRLLWLLWLCRVQDVDRVHRALCARNRLPLQHGSLRLLAQS